MSVSPLSDCSETGGTTESLTLLVFGGRAGGDWFNSTFGSGPRDSVAVSEEATAFTLSNACWTLSRGGWLTLAELLVLESWEPRLLSWRAGEKAEVGMPAPWRGRTGLTVPWCSSDDGSTSCSGLWAGLGELKYDLGGWGTNGEESDKRREKGSDVSLRGM